MSQPGAGHSNLLPLLIAIICTHILNVVYNIDSQKEGNYTRENKIKYEIKSKKSVKEILDIFALGIILNGVTPDFLINQIVYFSPQANFQKAMPTLSGATGIHLTDSSKIVFPITSPLPIFSDSLIS